MIARQGLLSNPVLKSGLISGSLSLAGDTVAQLITSRGSGQVRLRGCTLDQGASVTCVDLASQPIGIPALLRPFSCLA